MTSCLRTSLEDNNDWVLSDVTKESQSSPGVAIFGTGLQNEVGEYNCFLNVIIQVIFTSHKLFSFLGINVYNFQLKSFPFFYLF
jgi:hypothetical protein